MTALLVFALNEPVDLRHTHLTRNRGEAITLPPLADWLGTDTLDTDEIELFPVKDLGDMPLSDYLTLAFSPDPAIGADTRPRLDGLDGSVLLVPEDALDPAPVPGPQATLIARLPLADADHSAALPKARVAPMPRAEAPTAGEPVAVPRRLILWIALALVMSALIFGAL